MAISDTQAQIEARDRMERMNREQQQVENDSRALWIAASLIVVAILAYAGYTAYRAPLATTRATTSSSMNAGDSTTTTTTPAPSDTDTTGAPMENNSVTTTPSNNTNNQ